MPDSSTILLVDDEDSVQKLLTYPLERDGFRVVQARDGEQALRLFGDERIDLVVLDLMLPKVDGLEVCKRLRADSNVPIIMLTARGEELDKVLGLELGADDYITKPFSIREFRSRVRALLRRAGLPRERARVHLHGPGRRVPLSRLMNPLRTVGARLSLALLGVVAVVLGLVYLIVVPSLKSRLIDARLNDLAHARKALVAEYTKTPNDPD